MMSNTYQRGVTLVELSIVLIIIGILIYVGINFSQQIGDISKRQEMRNQEAAWEDIVDDIQRVYMLQLAEADGELTSPNGVNLTLTDAAVGGCGAAQNRAAIATLLNNFVVADSAEASSLRFNPWSQPWCLRVDDTTAVSLSGLEVVVRPLAVFSAGVQSGFQTTGGAPNILANGCPTSASGDSSHICASGVAAAAHALEINNNVMGIVAEKLQAYSRSQAILNPQGGFIDYFLNAAVDDTVNGCNAPLATPAYTFYANGPLAPTTQGFGTNGMQITDIIADNINFSNFEETLGITQSDAIDGFGGSLFLDNASCAARHPYNSDAGESTPPFSIRIVSILPGGETQSRFVFSDF